MSSQVIPARTLTEARSHSPWPRATTLVFALLTAALIGRAVFALWEPPFQGGILFDDIAPLGGAYWAMNVYLGGPAFLLSFIAGAIALVTLGRASVTSLIGGTLVVLGGSIFTPAIIAEVSPFALAANPDVMPAAQGRALFEVFNENHGVFLPPIILGSSVVALGIVIAMVGLLVAKAVPLWLSLGVLGYIVVFQVLPLGELHPAIGFVANALELVLWFLLGLFALLKVRRER